LSEYDDLLRKAREAEEQFRFIAKEIIPRMYVALRKENSNISASDARDRIIIDCIERWSKSTILDSLPDEAKDKEKPKPIDITISEITEQFLKIITYQINKWDTRIDEVRAYEELLNNVLFFLMKYSKTEFQIDVGEVEGLKKIRLHSNMWLSVWDVNYPNRVEPDVRVEQVLDYLYEPMKILENVIAVLTELAGANKEKIAELKVAQRIIKALSDDEQVGGGIEYKN
jgi:hypothetical protein